MKNTIHGLKAFLDASHSAYHAVAEVEKAMLAAGYTRLEEGQDWNLTAGGKYYLIRGGSALMAFRIPEGKPTGFLLSASHTDRPALKLKEGFSLEGKYTRAAVERYGGMILSGWLDRPLSVAGRVLVETQKGAERKLIDIDKDLMLIPNVAIHMNRQVNDGYKWNPAVDLLPLLGGSEAAGKLEALLEEAAGGKILGQDLYLYVREKATLWGVNEEYICAQGLDDLQCVWGCTVGFLNAGKTSAIPVLCLFDSEEVGSCSAQGAASTFLSDVLTRICRGLGQEQERLLAGSFLVSADNAHAIHPNHPEFADPTSAPTMGGGIVLKYNANLSYCTDGLSAAIFRAVCAKAGVPVQIYHNRADLPGGSTLGRISLGQVSIPTADIGLPQLAMHSCRETAAVKDAEYLAKAMESFYSAELKFVDGGFTLA